MGLWLGDIVGLNVGAVVVSADVSCIAGMQGTSSGSELVEHHFRVLDWVVDAN